MSVQIGTIVELDPIDALGWIELDEGGRVRFGGTSLRGFATNPGVGTRVEVWGTKPGYKGVPKADEVRPLLTPEAKQAARAAEEAKAAEVKTPWPDFVRAHPRWSDAADTCVPCTRPAPPPVLGEHPLFAPWLREIRGAAPTGVGLVVPDHMKLDTIDPGAADCFALGRIAYLDEPRWPACGVCVRPLEMCLQISPAVLADFLPGGRGLVALFCFHCGVSHCDDPRVGHVRLVEPRHRVLGPDLRETASSRPRTPTQRVRVRPPAAMVPDAMWHRHRSEVTPQPTASSELLGYGQPSITGPFPPGVDPDCFDDLDAAYDDWLATQPRVEPWSGACLGGVAAWDQAEATPSCPHGEMLHLLDHEGGQFLDGSLHVFACRELSCELAFVAEF